MPSPCLFHPLGAWALMVLLLFKAAGPALASAAAQGRGVALVEVCTVYGVRTVVVDTAGRPGQASPDRRPAEETTAQSGDACVLASLPSLDLPPVPGPQGLHGSAGEASPPPAPFSPAPLDASRAWWAGLKQGPPRS